MSDAPLRLVVIGCGFFAQNHLRAWRHVRGAQVVAVCDRDEARARAAAATFGVAAVYTDAATLLARERPDFVDIVTTPPSHRELVELAAAHRTAVICQKPAAPTLEDAGAMVAACERADVPYMVHENFRWQPAIRRARELVTTGAIGEPYFGRITFRSRHDVYRDQPYLATDRRFIIADLGVHLLDLARFFFGETDSLLCAARRVNSRIAGEDTATILLRSPSFACVIDMSYASHQECDLFPQTLVTIEGSDATVVVDANYEVALIQTGRRERVAILPENRPLPGEPPLRESVLAIQQHWVDCLREGRTPETSGRDNLKTLDLVLGAYRSAETGEAYRPGTLLAASANPLGPSPR